MNNFFENHFEEINLITNRSKKESRSTFTRLQKASIYKLESFNEKIFNENIYNLEGINVHQVTEDGKVLLGSSDRIYLPDIATRLYQELDDILKSYKSHKVHSKHSTPISTSENSSNVENIDLYDWDNEYFKELLTKLYESVELNVREKMNIIFELDGYHSLWNIFNPEHKSKEFDEFLLCLNYTVESKDTGETILNKCQKIQVNDIRSKRINFENAVEEINFASNTFLLSLSSKQQDKIKADAVILDHGLTSKVLAKLLSVDPDHSIFSESNEKNSYECIKEDYDKFGNQCDDENKLEEENKILRQSFFYESPKYTFRNFELNKKENLIKSTNIQSLLQQILNDYKLQKIIFIGGTKDIYFSEDCHDDIIIEPSIKVYFDGKDLRYLDLDFVEILNPNEINLIGGNSYHLHKRNDSSLFLGMNGFSYSLLPLKNINLI